MAKRREDNEEVTALRSLAEDGDAEAQATLGDMFWIGDGVKRDHGNAVFWYRKSAE